MKIKRQNSSFDSRQRRRSSLPIVPVVLLILLVAALWLMWSRGGEQPQVHVEKAIPAEKLGK
jgi:quinol-cytochrome oxidoreductase complex cytochrome b subunit